MVGLNEVMHVRCSALGLAQSKYSLAVSLKPKDGGDRMAVICCAPHSPADGCGLGFSGVGWNYESL